MENQNLSGNIKKSYWKFVLGFFGVILAVFVLVVGGYWGWQKYRYWQDGKIAQKAEEQIKKLQQEDYERAMADTYGGRTPQETLQMYIDAVEKGDYELASKYFVINKQKERQDILIKTKENDNINFLLNILKEISIEKGYYSTDRKIFTIEEPVFVEFILYPNNIWKLIKM